MPLNFSSLLICQWPFVGFLLRTAFCPTLGCDMHPERRMGQGLLKPHFGSALTIHGAHLQFHLRCWEGHRKAAEGLFKVSPSLLWNAQWIGGQLEVNTSSSSSSFCELPGCSSARGSEERLHTHRVSGWLLKGLLKCKPPELRVGNLSSIQGHRDTHTGKIITKKWFRLSGLQSEMNQRVNVHYLNIEKREYSTWISAGKGSSVSDAE